MVKAPLHRMAASVFISAVALILLAMAPAPPLSSQETPRVHGGGYSVPIPVGFHADSTSREFVRSLWEHGGVLLAHDSAPERIDVIIMLAGPSAGEEIPSTLQKCREGATGLVQTALEDGSKIDVKRAEMAETPQGPACQVVIIEPADAHMATSTIMTTDPLAYAVICNYDVRDGDTPQWCREVIDGWRIEPFPWEKTEDAESP